MVHKVSGYQTRDGKLFQTESEAVGHERKLDLGAWFTAQGLHEGYAERLLAEFDVVKKYIVPEKAPEPSGGEVISIGHQGGR